MTTETVLTNDQIMEQFELHIDDLERFRGCSDFARAIEQAVLQSEQVQALRKDAGRYRWLRQMIFDDRIIIAPDRMLFGEPLDSTIDAAMEQP